LLHWLVISFHILLLLKYPKRAVRWSSHLREGIPSAFMRKN
jgi:hypothetical protein